MQPRHRMPGLTADQIYTYPAKLWRKKRRSYLVTYAQPSRKMEIPMLDAVAEVPIPVEVAIPPVQHIINEDSKDSVPVAPSKDETTSKVIQLIILMLKLLWLYQFQDAWFYEDMQVEAEDFEEPDGDSDFDYEESSAKKRGKAKKDPPKKTPSKVITDYVTPVILLILIYSLVRWSWSQETNSSQLRCYRYWKAIFLWK